MAVEERSFIKIILLSIVTCGIYGYIFIYKLANDMNIVCAGDGEETADLLKYILFSLITCGIYAWYWYYKVADRQYKNASRYNVLISETGSTVLLWMTIGTLLLGVGSLVGLYMIINNMNILARAYNAMNGYGQGSGMNGYGPNNGMNGYGQGSGMNGYGPNNGMNNTPYDSGRGNQNLYIQQPPAANDSMSYRPTQKLEMPAGYQDNAASFSIVCEAGEFAGSEIEIKPNDSITIGRTPDNNLKFADDTPNLSRSHCVIKNENGLFIMDRGSSFGTFIDGRKIQPQTWNMLAKGASFSLGSDMIKFRVV